MQFHVLFHSDLLDGKLSEFTITSKADESDYGSDVDIEDEDDGDEYDESRNIQTDSQILDIPFAQMKQDMFLIHYGIYKKILTEGTGELVPDTARVSMDYSGFWEGQSTPFETSWIHKKPRLQRIGEDMLPGLYYCLLSMRVNEVAKFIVPYQLLYGVLGCEVAGIPAKADGQYIIRLISFQDVGDSGAINDECIDEYESYEKVLERVEIVRKSGRANFADGKFEEAAKDFRKCITALKYCHGAKEQERAEILEKMYVNVCVCFNKLERPLEVLKMRDELMQCLGSNGKALFQIGRAHFKQGDYTEALRYLAKAQALEPNNKEVAQELKLVNETNENYKKDIKEISKKALQNTSETVVKAKVNSKETGIYKMLEARVNHFLGDSTMKEDLLPINLSAAELAIVKDIAEEYKLHVEQRNVNNEKWHYLVK